MCTRDKWILTLMTLLNHYSTLANRISLENGNPFAMCPYRLSHPFLPIIIPQAETRFVAEDCSVPFSPPHNSVATQLHTFMTMASKHPLQSNLIQNLHQQIIAKISASILAYLKYPVQRAKCPQFYYISQIQHDVVCSD